MTNPPPAASGIASEVDGFIGIVLIQSCSAMQQAAKKKTKYPDPRFIFSTK